MVCENIALKIFRLPKNGMKAVKSLVPARWFSEELRLAARTKSAPRDLFEVRQSEEKLIDMIQQSIKEAEKNGAYKYSLSQGPKPSAKATSMLTSDFPSFFSESGQRSVYGTAGQQLMVSV